MTFQFPTLFSVMPALAEAALVNLRLAAIIVALSIIGGTALTIIRVMKIGPVNLVLNVLISFIRGTPLLIQIFAFYYVAPAFGLDLRPEAAGIAAISINSAIFVTEIMRGGLQTIDPGQIEAASALALSRRAIWQRIVLPQLFRRIAPVLVSEITIVVKGTALLSVITVVEVLRTAQQIASSTYRPFETLVGAALCFLVINLAVMAVGTIIERRTRMARA
ncbi:MAG: amino acid ABC transporter permease [Aurantimonas endophytica]|jgi:His/Glu/Gln/Arg/opine family amino acid ABC transporter permease subunit|uniref:His/Glu/Gln/Arg/opine family amino acid ABC transporter permease subunit n=1 Tax=Aurantimonas endophytica TaxID=1522175 RepID=A0A7W6MQ58_9HYPH|nr:amino acid ABC transporter permease [Aurantimonas endophytica]MBB4003650.1 His/Glu/Gln/Arg/opine family amino acid ABC transporter permease subunit [Aurantimonas endophytica]MCO6404508.1 ABC transporter permease subunit [Aurantimonas endophytica]